MPNIYAPYEEHLNTLKNLNRYRQLSPSPQEASHKQGVTILDLSTNDYLCLSRHQDVIQAAQNAACVYGVGGTGSRLLSGNYALCETFEQAIAQDKNAPSALLFNSGFQANISALSCLLDEGVTQQKPLVFFDKYNHASLYKAVFLSKAELKRYHHGDANHLESLLKKHAHDAKPKFIITETVFGMDGDIAPLDDIASLAKKYNAFLYLDDAHAVGVLGQHGYGLSSKHLNLETSSPLPHVVMGTLSKAVGVSGGYIACHKVVRDFIINKGTGFVYSTAPSPLVVGAAFKAWQMIRGFHQERQQLHNVASTLRAKLKEGGFNIGASQTHIIPIILGDETACLTVQKKLLQEEGIVVSCVRPPTVPPNTSRLRVALTIKHTVGDAIRFVEALYKTVNTL